MQDLKDTLITLCFTLLGKLPLNPGRRVGRFLGWLLTITPNYNRRVTEVNIKLCYPELSPEEQKRLIRQSLLNTGVLTMEVAAIWQRPWSWLEPYILSIEGQEIIDKAIASDKGLMVLAPHLGNWEVIGPYLSRLAPMLNLYEPPESAAMEKIIHHGRTKSGSQLAPTNQRGIAMLLKHLRRGNMIGILPDQVPESRERGGVYAPFFKHTAYTMTLASQLIQKTGCTAVFAVAQRINGGFKLLFVEAPAKVYSENEEESATAINQTIEQLVRDMPEQYQWEYKRFKRLPKGYPKLY